MTTPTTSHASAAGVDLTETDRLLKRAAADTVALKDDPTRRSYVNGTPLPDFRGGQRKALACQSGGAGGSGAPVVRAGW